MTNVEILTKAVNLALSRGWKPIEDMQDMQDMEVGPSDVTFLGDKRRVYFDVNRILFDHDFAKALWGETKLLENGEYPPEVIMYKGKPTWHPWIHHLQNMVIADNRLQYLYENLPNS